MIYPAFVRKMSVNRTVLSVIVMLSLLLTNAPFATANEPAHISTLSAPVITTTTTVVTEDAPADDTAEETEVTVEEVVIEDVTATTSVIVRPVAIKNYRVSMTAYNSEVGQTDDSPFTTADGSHVRDGIIAANFLPFGTKVRFPTLFGDRVFEVRDRMNARYTSRIDIWMVNKKDAMQFGLKSNVPVEVIEMGDGVTEWSRIAARKAKARQEALQAKALATNS